MAMAGRAGAQAMGDLRSADASSCGILQLVRGRGPALHVDSNRERSKIAQTGRKEIYSGAATGSNSAVIAKSHTVQAQKREKGKRKRITISYPKVSRRRDPACSGTPSTCTSLQWAWSDAPHCHSLTALPLFFTRVNWLCERVR
ncbi:hypothetical protein M758_6G036400 [Ceratodon purpureus]|nr:hypothetical protein M758_6G036400 [Ceratodon purpureus]